ncbi:DUF4097 family beta strand repeat-containing protein [Microbacterium sp. P04]|uniref:DUF4097 family beta strand repeat-containing protein n=1 Tax=Microbacterium sp. P04 TaxID=3366947 RepID=UPI0037464632
MTTDISPPAPDQPPQSAPPRPGAAPRVIALLTAALGVGVLAVSVTGGVLPTVATAAARDEESAIAVDGVSALDVDVSAMSLEVVFAEVDRASLEVRGNTGSGGWTFERDGDVLRVETPRQSFFSWFGGDNGRATLILPERLAGLDADLRVGGGSIDVAGDYDDLAIDLGAGEVTVDASARSLSADVSAGRGDIALTDVATARLSLGAGELITRLSGSAPRDVQASVSAGSLEITLPDETYAVTSDVSAGDVDNALQTSADSPRTVHVEVSAGNARLRAE